jgi:hypothetical protein
VATTNPIFARKKIKIPFELLLCKCHEKINIKKYIYYKIYTQCEHDILTMMIYSVNIIKILSVHILKNDSNRKIYSVNMIKIMHQVLVVFKLNN